MAQQRDTSQRAKGPVRDEHGGWKYRYPKTGYPAIWQVVRLDGPTKKQKSKTYPFKDERSEQIELARALADVDLFNCEAKLAEGTTIADGIEAYPEALKAGYDAPWTKTGTREPLGKAAIVTEIHRLEAFFDDEELLALPVAELTGEQCKVRFAALKASQAFDTVYYTVGVARRFLRWCVLKKWARESAMEAAGIRVPKGGLNHGGKGKKQLTFDEMKIWTAKAFELAEDGDVGAVAALIPQYTLLRAEMVVTRRVRDVDLDGAMIWVKDKQSNRTKKVPEQNGILEPRMWALLQSLKLGRDPGEWLFPGERLRTMGRRRREWLTDQIQRICKLAGLPEKATHAHGMRGAGMSAGNLNGELLALLRSRAGHTDGGQVMERSYLSAESIQKRRQRGLMVALAGGKN